MSKYKVEIEEIKKELDRANKLKVQAETRLEDLKLQRERLLKEIEEYGVKPEELEGEIESLENELKSLISKAKDLLPDKDTLEGRVG